MDEAQWIRKSAVTIVFTAILGLPALAQAGVEAMGDGFLYDAECFASAPVGTFTRCRIRELTEAEKTSWQVEDGRRVAAVRAEEEQQAARRQAEEARRPKVTPPAASPASQEAEAARLAYEAQRAAAEEEQRYYQMLQQRAEEEKKEAALRRQFCNTAMLTRNRYLIAQSCGIVLPESPRPAAVVEPEPTRKSRPVQYETRCYSNRAGSGVTTRCDTTEQ